MPKYIIRHRGEVIAEADNILDLKELVCKYFQIPNAPKLYLSDLIQHYNLEFTKEG